MNEEEEKYKLTSHWAEHFLEEIERKLEAALLDSSKRHLLQTSGFTPEENSIL